MKKKKSDVEYATITVSKQAPFPHKIEPSRYNSDERTAREDEKVFRKHNQSVEARLRKAGVH